MDTAPKPPVWKRMLRALITSALTVIVVVGAGVVVMFGAGALAERAALVPEPQAAALTQVSVQPLQIDPGYEVTRRFVGQVESGATVALSFELGGRLSALLVAEGDAVARGQEIARLDMALLKAEAARLDASRAAIASQLEFAETRLARVDALRDEGFSSQEALDQARTTRDELRNRIAEIEAGIATVEINLEKSVLLAPFDGRVGAQMVDGGETLAAGQQVLTLLETGATEVRVGLPLSITTDMLKSVEVEINGTVHAATLKHMRPDIDPVTRTRTAIFALQGEATPLFGQIATLHLHGQVAASGSWVPIDALQEGAGSVWTVLVVDDGIVRPATVEVLFAEARQAYVKGSFEDGALLVRSGAHRVVPGQQVATIAADD